MTDDVKATVVVEDWYNDPARSKHAPTVYTPVPQAPPILDAQARANVAKGEAALMGQKPMTTIHGKRERAERWAGAVHAQAKTVAPDRKPQFAEWFQFYARLGAMQGPTHAARFSKDTRDERETRVALSKLDERHVTDALNALEATPYVVAYAKGGFKLFARGRDAVNHARASKGAMVHFVSMTYRVIDGLSQTLPRPDRARGPSSVLAGQGTKVVQHRVATMLTQVRVF